MTQETLFAGMIFVVVLLMTQAFVAPVMGSRQAARKRLRQRIRNLATTSDGSTHAALVRQKYLQSLSPLERKLESLPHVERLAAIVSQAGMNFPAHRLLILGALLGLTAGAALYVRTDSLVAGLLAATVAAAAPVMYVNRKRMKRLRDFEERLPDALSVIARSLKAGLPFSESIKMVSTEMEGPVSDEFRRLFAELNYGGDVRSALFGLLERVPSVSVMAVVTAVVRCPDENTVLQGAGSPESEHPLQPGAGIVCLVRPQAMITAGNGHAIEIEESQCPQPLESIEAPENAPGGYQHQRDQGQADKNCDVDSDQRWFSSGVGHRCSQSSAVNRTPMLAAGT